MKNKEFKAEVVNDLRYTCLYIVDLIMIYLENKMSFKEIVSYVWQFP